MPEPRIIPRGCAIRPVPLPDGALDEIRRRARQRKSGRAAAVASAAAMAVVLVTVSGVSTVLTQDREDSLRIGPAGSIPNGPVVPSPDGAAQEQPTPPADPVTGLEHEPDAQHVPSGPRVRPSHSLPVAEPVAPRPARTSAARSRDDGPWSVRP